MALKISKFLLNFLSVKLLTYQLSLVYILEAKEKLQNKSNGEFTKWKEISLSEMLKK
jgi:hypothetical protein